MTIEELQKTIKETQEQLNNMAIQLVRQHPQGAKLIGKIEAYEEMIKELQKPN